MQFYQTEILNRFWLFLIQFHSFWIQKDYKFRSRDFLYFEESNWFFINVRR